MKREIKFRAWDAKEKQMLEVNHLFNLDNKQPIEVWTNYYEGGYRFNPDKSELMQYTGLTDANGEEIYEGDLVTLTDDSEDPIYRVIFDEAKFEISGGGVLYDLGEEFMNCEVIGNVHENPELLEAKSNATDNESQG